MGWEKINQKIYIKQECNTWLEQRHINDSFIRIKDRTNILYLHYYSPSAPKMAKVLVFLLNRAACKRENTNEI